MIGFNLTKHSSSYYYSLIGQVKAGHLIKKDTQHRHTNFSGQKMALLKIKVDRCGSPINYNLSGRWRMPRRSPQGEAASRRRAEFLSTPLRGARSQAGVSEQRERLVWA